MKVNVVVYYFYCCRVVILAPFGMAGTLTGQSGRALDAATSRLLEEWRHFYPITPRENNDSSLPQAVEVSRFFLFYILSYNFLNKI